MRLFSKLLFCRILDQCGIVKLQNDAEIDKVLNIQMGPEGLKNCQISKLCQRSIELGWLLHLIKKLFA